MKSRCPNKLRCLLTLWLQFDRKHSNKYYQHTTTITIIANHRIHLTKLWTHQWYCILLNQAPLKYNWLCDGVRAYRNRCQHQWDNEKYIANTINNFGQTYNNHFGNGHRISPASILKLSYLVGFSSNCFTSQLNWLFLKYRLPFYHAHSISAIQCTLKLSLDSSNQLQIHT